MRKLQTSTVLWFLDAVTGGKVKTQNRGRTLLCMLFGKQHGVRTMLDGSEFSLTALSARLIFNRDVHQTFEPEARAVYMALSSRTDVSALYGRQITLSVPGFDVIGKLRASAFQSPLGYLTGRHYCQLKVLAVTGTGCDSCHNRTAGRRCLDSCAHKSAIKERRA